MTDKRTKEQKEAAAKVDKDAEGAAEAANEQVQKAADVEQDQGFRGVEVDQTPNENYTVTGDHSKTPEAQPDPVAARREASVADPERQA